MPVWLGAQFKGQNLSPSELWEYRSSISSVWLLSRPTSKWFLVLPKYLCILSLSLKAVSNFPLFSVPRNWAVTRLDAHAFSTYPAQQSAVFRYEDSVLLQRWEIFSHYFFFPWLPSIPFVLFCVLGAWSSVSLPGPCSSPAPRMPSDSIWGKHGCCPMLRAGWGGGFQVAQLLQSCPWGDPEGHPWALRFCWPLSQGFSVMPFPYVHSYPFLPLRDSSKCLIHYPSCSISSFWAWI